MRKLLTILIIVAALVAVYYILTYDADSWEDPDTTEVQPQGETTVGETGGPVRLISWNLLNLGGSKDDQEIAIMAALLRDADVVAIQEVITSPPGAQAVARLADELSRTGTRWDYIVSDPTTGTGSERYAYLWKPSRIKVVGRPWLEPSLADPLDREPYLARFEAGGRTFTVASFHAVPTAKKPADEIAFLDELHRRYPDDNLLILGDFNLSQKHRAFDELKALGYQPALVDQRTSIRMRRKDGQHLANEYDNIFYEAAPLRLSRPAVLDFTGQFPTLRDARKISDHLPVYAEVSWN